VKLGREADQIRQLADRVQITEAGEPIETENVQPGASVAAPPPNPGETSDASDEPANA